MKRFTLIAVMGSTFFATACTSIRPMPVEQVREATREAEPTCFLQFNECDENGANCRLVRTEYKASDGKSHTWQDCNIEYDAWLKRLNKAHALLRKQDPLPACFKPSSEVLTAMGADPKDPDALLTLAEAGYMVGNGPCTMEWCEWMKRNSAPDHTLPNTCTHGQ